MPDRQDSQLAQDLLVYLAGSAYRIAPFLRPEFRYSWGNVDGTIPTHFDLVMPCTYCIYKGNCAICFCRGAWAGVKLILHFLLASRRSSFRKARYPRFICNNIFTYCIFVFPLFSYVSSCDLNKCLRKFKIFLNIKHCIFSNL